MKYDVNLEVEFAGVKMRSPFGVASQAPKSPPAIAAEPMAELLLMHADAGVGYIHTPFVNPQVDHPSNMLPTGRFLKASTRRFGIDGWFGCADAGRIMMRLDVGLKMIDLVKKKLPPDVPIIANIIGPGADPAGWANHARKFEEAGVDIIELNVSCPLPGGASQAVDTCDSEELPEAAGALLGDKPALAIAVTREVVRACSVPVGVKLSAETGFPRIIGFVQRLKEVGARFVTSVNGSMSVAPPDIYRGGRPQWPGMEYNVICSATGNWIRPLCYRNIGTISMFVPGFDQAAVGGLVDPQHAVEAMMLGAKIVEFSSGTLWKGWKFIKQATTFLEKYMAEQGYHSLGDFRGAALQYIRPVNTIDWGVGKLAAKIDPDKCTGCGICVDNLCWATYMENKKAWVREEWCGACALCVGVCPVDAITLGKATIQRTEEEIYALVQNSYAPKWG